ncbi:hypothetical protein GCM10009759_57640 [Kitasatospora saccharophila]|uniref:PH (Pleckstrin Homology) domain-containing protein n=2 Tax=Kitasatospora saccharophila TaxID=407973 RepID=A0ABN2XLU7_9ACTN
MDDAVGGPMKPVKRSSPARIALVGVGLGFLLISVASLADSSAAGERAFHAVLLVASVVWCFRVARTGLVVDRHGIVLRSIGRSRRVSWRQVKVVEVREAGRPGTLDCWLIELRLRGGRVLRLEETTSRTRSHVEEFGRRMVALRPAHLGDGIELLGLEGTGRPDKDAVVGPDGVPVLVRLTGPGGVQLNWSAAVLPDGPLIALVALVLIGIGKLVSAVVREIRKKPKYEVDIEVGGPEPRRVTLPFDSRARATERVRELVAAIGERGAEAVPGASER